MAAPFKLGIVRDVLNAAGEPSFGSRALDVLKGNPLIEGDYTSQSVKEIPAEWAARYDALYVNSSRVNAATVGRADRRLRIVARHGVGYDSVDVPAMTNAGVLVTHTPAAMPRPVATIALTFFVAVDARLML